MCGSEPNSRQGRPRVLGEVVRRTIAGETILVPVRGKVADMRRMYALNPTAAFIWERLDGARTVGQLLEELLATFDADPAAAEADLTAFVETAVAEGLVEVAG